MSIETATSIATVMSAVASAVSAAIAWEAMRQAKRAATLAPKSEAINYLHAAVAGLKRGTPLSADVQESVQKAKGIADRVFSVRVRNKLNTMLETIRSLDRNNPGDWGKPIAELESLIARMNEEAELSR
jgi:hypothetical protein